MLATPPHGAPVTARQNEGADARAHAPAHRMSSKQMIGLAAAVIVVLAVIGRACSEDPARNPMRGPGAASEGMPVPPGPPGPRDPRDPRGPHGPDGDPEAPLRFEMPHDLDRKGAQAWGEVARAVNEGRLNKALEKLDKLEHRFGESEESAQLRAWLEQHAGSSDEDD